MWAALYQWLRRVQKRFKACFFPPKDTLQDSYLKSNQRNNIYTHKRSYCPMYRNNMNKNTMNTNRGLMGKNNVRGELTVGMGVDGAGETMGEKAGQL